MRRGRFLVGLGAVSACASTSLRLAFAQGLPSRPIRVRLFAGVEVRSADIAGVHVDATSAPTIVSTKADPLPVSAVTSDGSTIARRYAGSILTSNVDGRLALFNDVDIEAYVASVLSSEISSGWHPEALRAQAIAVRTYGLRRMVHKRPATYDVVDDTTNQVYHGVDGIVPSLQAAAGATKGQWLSWLDQPADVWYHSSCGGHTASPSEITGTPAPPYLSGIADVDSNDRAYCSASPYFTWRNTLTAALVARVAGVESVSSASVVDSWPDGRVKTVRVQSADGTSHDFVGHDFYSRAAAVLGYKVVPSALFTLSSGSDGSFVLTGHGVGHGVGMCQWGAQGRAKAGYKSDAILQAYFPGTGIMTPIDVF